MDFSKKLNDSQPGLTHRSDFQTPPCERSERGYNYAKDNGLIYDNGCGTTLRYLHPIDLELLVQTGYLYEADDCTYHRTDKPYNGLIFSDLLDTLSFYDVALTPGFIVETKD